MCQPANSPETNVLDLGFFRALQAGQIKMDAKTVDDIVANVSAAGAAVPYETLLNNFRTLQLVLIKILRHDGGNDFKLPHIGKAKLERMGQLQDAPTVELEVVGVAMARLTEAD